MNTFNPTSLKISFNTFLSSLVVPGAELREIQKQINHLENPHDPQEVHELDYTILLTVSHAFGTLLVLRI